MSQYVGSETIPLSYLNAIEYCPRRFYYEFVEGDMLENEFVLSGSLLHERTDQPHPAQCAFHHTPVNYGTVNLEIGIGCSP